MRRKGPDRKNHNGIKPGQLILPVRALSFFTEISCLIGMGMTFSHGKAVLPVFSTVVSVQAVMICLVRKLDAERKTVPPFPIVLSCEVLYRNILRSTMPALPLFPSVFPVVLTAGPVSFYDGYAKELL